jgi:hypothetical protein
MRSSAVVQESFSLACPVEDSEIEATPNLLEAALTEMGDRPEDRLTVKMLPMLPITILQTVKTA